jgi:hypothetical protein
VLVELIYTTGTVKVRTRSTFTDYGEPSFSTAVTVRARVNEVRRLVIDRLGQEAVSTAEVLVGGSVSIGDGMQVSLDDGTTYRDVIAVTKARDINGGVSHYVLHLAGSGL